MMWGIDNLTVRFGKVRALQRVSLALAPGSVHAVVGGDGAGKTTLLRLLYGGDRADKGASARQVVSGLSTAQIHNVNRITLELAKQEFSEWARELSRPGAPVRFELVDVQGRPGRGGMAAVAGFQDTVFCGPLTSPVPATACTFCGGRFGSNTGPDEPPFPPPQATSPIRNPAIPPGFRKACTLIIAPPGAGKCWSLKATRLTLVDALSPSSHRPRSSRAADATGLLPGSSVRAGHHAGQ